MNIFQHTLKRKKQKKLLMHSTGIIECTTATLKQFKNDTLFGKQTRKHHLFVLRLFKIQTYTYILNAAVDFEKYLNHSDSTIATTRNTSKFYETLTKRSVEVRFEQLKL